MTSTQQHEFLDERNAFEALAKELSYQTGQMKDKEKQYKENFMKSFICRSHFKTKTLVEFQEYVEGLNLNVKPLKKKSREQEQAEKLKHDQNKRACEKRGLPRFDMEMARRLLEGKFHEMEDEDEGDFDVNAKSHFDPSKAINVQSREELRQNN
jgi:hypothetical protein